MSRRSILVVIGAACVAVLGVIWLASSHSAKASADKRPYQYCPRCGFSRPADASSPLSDKTPCPRCGRKSFLKLSYGPPPGKDGGGSIISGKYVARTILGLTAAVSLTWLGILVFRWRGVKRSGEEPLYYFSCKKCKRKIRYRSSQFGGKALCPRCKVEIQFPTYAGPAA